VPRPGPHRVPRGASATHPGRTTLPGRRDGLERPSYGRKQRPARPPRPAVPVADAAQELHCPRIAIRKRIALILHRQSQRPDSTGDGGHLFQDAQVLYCS